MEPAAQPSLDKARHVKYWQRCLNTHLPSAYTANDSTRLTFAYFIVSALDLLDEPLSAGHRATIRAWVLSLQHPAGGFCGSSTHSLPGPHAARGSANLAATFFALLLLGLAAGTDAEARVAFAGVRRGKLLRWLRALQRPDGSFGQVLWDGEPCGGRDTRHAYLASGIRWMLRGHVSPGHESPGHDAWVPDVDVDAMVRSIHQGQTYDGGLAEASAHESHAGYAYCGIAALHLLRYSDPSCSSKPSVWSPDDKRTLLSFLANRPFQYLASEEAGEEADEENFLEPGLGGSPAEGPAYIGYNGRWNKKADTCYCWWVAGALESLTTGGNIQMLDGRGMVSVQPSRRYILDITQHRIGGFSKSVGGPPDVFHSFLGLAALSLMGEPELKDFDVALCCSSDTRRKLELARQGLLEVKTGFDGDGFWDSLRS
ncbi:hypothetical protein HIM_00787 [Hirsutella minnesotensis 3608]|nr:hypothetical protein HIM_00787 [Hirsutella minnesotensis 3608]